MFYLSALLYFDKNDSHFLSLESVVLLHITGLRNTERRWSRWRRKLKVKYLMHFDKVNNRSFKTYELLLLKPRRRSWIRLQFQIRQPTATQARYRRFPTDSNIKSWGSLATCNSFQAPSFQHRLDYFPL